MHTFTHMHTHTRQIKVHRSHITHMHARTLAKREKGTDRAKACSGKHTMWATMHWDGGRRLYKCTGKASKPKVITQADANKTQTKTKGVQFLKCVQTGRVGQKTRTTTCGGGACADSARVPRGQVHRDTGKTCRNVIVPKHVPTNRCAKGYWRYMAKSAKGADQKYTGRVCAKHSKGAQNSAAKACTSKVHGTGGAKDTVQKDTGKFAKERVTKSKTGRVCKRDGQKVHGALCQKYTGRVRKRHGQKVHGTLCPKYTGGGVVHGGPVRKRHGQKVHGALCQKYTGASSQKTRSKSTRSIAPKVHGASSHKTRSKSTRSIAPKVHGRRFRKRHGQKYTGASSQKTRSKSTRNIVPKVHGGGGSSQSTRGARSQKTRSKSTRSIVPKVHGGEFAKDTVKKYTEHCAKSTRGEFAKDTDKKYTEHCAKSTREAISQKTRPKVHGASSQKTRSKSTRSIVPKVRGGSSQSTRGAGSQKTRSKKYTEHCAKSTRGRVRKRHGQKVHGALCQKYTGRVRKVHGGQVRKRHGRKSTRSIVPKVHGGEFAKDTVNKHTEHCARSTRGEFAKDTVRWPKDTGQKHNRRGQIKAGDWANYTPPTPGV